MDLYRLRGIALIVVGAGLIAGCGSEPPAPGELAVTSEPPGAAITLDGQSNGAVTPYTFEDLEGGTNYTVSVAMDGWAVFPADRSVDVPFGSRVEAAFTLSQAVGALVVTSEPAGAGILIDDADTGEVTPHTFDTLVPGDYTVTVDLANHVSQPAEIVVTIEDGDTASADFTLMVENIPRVVLFESFSNVYCVGCPAMNDNVAFVQQQPGYGPDRILDVKWPAILSALDPFYWVTTTITDNRVDWYFGSSQINLPSLTADGAVLGALGSPVSADGMMAFIDGQPEFADFLITVETDEDLGDVTDLTHEATVTLLSPGGVDLTGHHLNVVLVYEEVETENEGYIDGVTIYHWVMRDHVQPSTDLGLLDPGVSYPFDVTLTDPLGGELTGHAVYPQNKQIIAWVQHATSRAILQAGSTVPAPAPVPAASAVSNPGAPDVHPGGPR